MNLAPRYLTKSRFKLAVECPTKLYYTGKPDYANTKDEDEFLAMLADGGFQVGELAKLKYHGGIEIKTKKVAQAIAETEELLERENVILFEPAIAHKGFLVRVDVLIKRGSVFEVIEVKAKSYSGDPADFTSAKGAISSKYLPYIQDVAFQKYVLQCAFPQATVSAHLLMPDKSKKATVAGLNQLFKIRRQGKNVDVQVSPRAYELAGEGDLAESVLTCVSVDHLAQEVLSNALSFPGGKGPLQTVAAKWAEAYEADRKLPPVIGKQCGRCEFKVSHKGGTGGMGGIGGTSEPSAQAQRSGFHECWKEANRWTDADFAGGTVLDIWSFHGKDKLINQGKLKLSQVTEEDLKVTDHDYSPITNPQRQWLQVAGLPPEFRARGYYLDTAGLQAEVRNWTWPLHLIDFETAAVALPFHAGRRPYEQVAFQFSHHVLEADGTLRHANQYLNDTPSEFPNYDFVRALRESLRHDRGTIMRWSHHENTILNTIKSQFSLERDKHQDADDLIAFIEEITTEGSRAMVDLAKVAKDRYFHPSTRGSSSIKKVLPAVLQSSAYLRERFGTPTYGSPRGPTSLNFESMAWWQQGQDGTVLDPYKILIGELGEEDLEDDDEGAEQINQGGAASNAYLRLQFEDLSAQERASLRKALLRYCELDTLAMGMVVLAWLNDPV